MLSTDIAHVLYSGNDSTYAALKLRAPGWQAGACRWRSPSARSHAFWAVCASPGFRDNAQVTNAAVAPTGNPTFFAPLMALIANADRFSPESARQVRLSTHYPCTEDRYFNFLRYARE